MSKLTQNNIDNLSFAIGYLRGLSTVIMTEDLDKKRKAEIADDLILVSKGLGFLEECLIEELLAE